MKEVKEIKQEIKKLPRLLNLGSGNRKKSVEEGWINIDIDATCNPDIVRNLDDGLPFDTNSVDGVHCSQTIEHIDDIFYFMYEIWRVCKPDAHVEIVAPNHAHLFSIFPNHKRFIRPQYFEQWTPLEMWGDYLTLMNNQAETYGAEFVSLNESIIENSSAIRFQLQVVKEGGKIKKQLKEQFKKQNKDTILKSNTTYISKNDATTRKEKMILNIGCGEIKMLKKEKEEVINIDIEPFWNPDLVRDAERGLPFDNNSVDEIYSSHFLEHVHPDKINFFMYECWRVLKKKGLFKCIVPIGKSWMASPYHVAPMNERTPLFFTHFNHKEITGFDFKLIKTGTRRGMIDGKEVDWTDELHFELEVIK